RRGVRLRRVPGRGAGGSGDGAPRRPLPRDRVHQPGPHGRSRPLVARLGYEDDRRGHHVRPLGDPACPRPAPPDARPLPVRSPGLRDLSPRADRRGVPRGRVGEPRAGREPRHPGRPAALSRRAGSSAVLAASHRSSPRPSAAGPVASLAMRLVPIGAITLVFNLGGGLIAPALPLYARTLGADYRALGLIGASHGLAFAGLTIPLGRASDRFGRRAVLLFSTLAVAAAAGLYLLAGGVPGLAGAKLIEAAGWAAFWPALEAWVAERFGARAGAAMGLAYGAYAAAFVVGTAAAGFVIEAGGLRAPFGCYLVTALLALGLIAALAGGRAMGRGHAGHATA